MTSSPTPAVLPDARALDTFTVEACASHLDERAANRKIAENKAREEGDIEDAVTHARIGNALRSAATAVRALDPKEATSPASDAAVPAGEVDRLARIIYGWTPRIRDYDSGLPGDIAVAKRQAREIIAAAPKVASDTGAGLREGVTQLDESDEAMICTGCGTTRSIAGIKQMSETAFSCCPERKMVAARDMWRVWSNVHDAATPTDATDGATGGGGR
jgi:hypothetical protein